MEPEYLSDLELSPEEHAKLAGLGASSAAALWSLWEAAPKEMDRLLEAQRSTEIHERLRALLTPEERERLDLSHSVKKYPLGASLRTPPAHLPPPRFDIEKRDRLFEEIQALRDAGGRSEMADEHILELERELNELLEKR